MTAPPMEGEHLRLVCCIEGIDFNTVEVLAGTQNSVTDLADLILRVLPRGLERPGAKPSEVRLFKISNPGSETNRQLLKNETVETTPMTVGLLESFFPVLPSRAHYTVLVRLPPPVQVELVYLILGDDRQPEFPVIPIQTSQLVKDLADALVAEITVPQPDVGATKLQLFQVEVEKSDTSLNSLNSSMEPQGAIIMDPTRKVSKYFRQLPKQGHYHLLVKRSPSTESPWEKFGRSANASPFKELTFIARARHDWGDLSYVMLNNVVERRKSEHLLKLVDLLRQPRRFAEVCDVWEA